MTYIESKAIYLAQLAARQQRINALCEVCEVKPAIQIHHKARRRGVRLTDQANFCGVCVECHNRIEANPKWAKTQGFLIKNMEVRL